MKSKKVWVVVAGALIAALGSMSSAIGLFSVPQSAAVGVTAYRDQYISANSYQPIPGGYRSMYFTANVNFGAGLALPPLTVGSGRSQQFFASVWECKFNSCSIVVQAHGSYPTSAWSNKPLQNRVRFTLPTSCGNIDLDWHNGLPVLAPNQIVNPNVISATASIGTSNSGAVTGVICGRPVANGYGYTNDYLTLGAFLNLGAASVPLP